MALEDDVKQALMDAGSQLKHDLWKSGDQAFLAARARDLIGLNLKAQTTTDPIRKKAYQAAARDTVESVKMLALIRAERVPEHLVDALGRFFLDRALPVLVKLLPAIVAAL